MSALEWIRCGDALPGVCEPVLTAKWDDLRQLWKVYDGKLYIRYEGVVPDVRAVDGAKMPTDFWFDSIYPGTGNMRLVTPDLLWTPLPHPDLQNLLDITVLKEDAR